MNFKIHNNLTFYGKSNLSNDPINELNYVRPSLLVNLLNIISLNESTILDNQFAFFEEGKIFTSCDKQGQHNSIAGVYYGNAIQNDYFKETRAFDIYDAKQTLFELLKKLYSVNIKNVKITKCEQIYTHPTRSFDISVKNKDGNSIIARFGEISPLVLKSFGIKKPVCFFEVFSDLLPLQKKQKQFVENNNLQPIVRDIAFVVDNNVTADRILDAYKIISFNNEKIEGCENFQSIEQGIEFAKQNGENELFIIGGASIYKYCAEHNLFDRVYVSHMIY